MNQILSTKNNFYDIPITSCSIQSLTKQNKKKKYFIIFLISISISIIILIYLLFVYFLRLKFKNESNTLKKMYNITTLYSSNNNYSTLKLSNNLTIIGLIEIPKINISYPILADTTEELLKISVCRFSGPLPNRIGNLCIAGHNYKNSLMFSNINQLSLNDKIYITDLNNVKLEYIIYEKFKVKEYDLNCIKSTNNIEITLITCNSNNNSERIIIKAKAKE